MNKLFWLIYVQPLHRIMIFMIMAAVLWGYLGNRAAGGGGYSTRPFLPGSRR